MCKTEMRVEVEQVDREAAACLAKHTVLETDEMFVAWRLLRNGKADATPLVQAFARHRREAQAEMSTRLATLESVVRKCGEAFRAYEAAHKADASSASVVSHLLAANHTARADAARALAELCERAEGGGEADKALDV